jgi:hypothetical protein
MHTFHSSLPPCLLAQYDDLILQNRVERRALAHVRDQGWPKHPGSARPINDILSFHSAPITQARADIRPLSNPH